jgi:hypothetical protein
MVTLKKSTGMETVLVESGAEGTGQKVQLEEITRSSKRGPPESRDLFSLAAGDFSVPIWPIGLYSRKCLDAYAMIKQAM